MKGNLSQAQGGDAGSGARQRDPRVYRLEVEEQTQHGPGKAECDRDGGGEEAGVLGGGTSRKALEAGKPQFIIQTGTRSERHFALGEMNTGMVPGRQDAWPRHLLGPRAG